MLTGAITPSAWASCPSQRKLSQKIKPEHSNPSMLLYRNINPALKCELPKGPKKSDCLGRMDAGRASEETELSFPRPGNCGIAVDHTHPWSSVTFPLPPGSRAGVNGHTHSQCQYRELQFQAILEHPLELRWHRELPTVLPTRTPGHGSGRCPSPERRNSWRPCRKPRARGRDGNAGTKQQEQLGWDPALRA